MEEVNKFEGYQEDRRESYQESYAEDPEQPYEESYEQPYAGGYDQAYEGGYGQPYQAEPPKRKRRRWIYIAAAALALALAAVGAILVLPKLLGGSSSADEWGLKNAYVASDKSVAYIALPGGETIKVKGDGIVRASVSADSKRVAVLLDDGTLYVADKNLQNKWTVADDAKAYYLGDDAVIYRDKDGRYHRATFKNKEVLDLPKEISNTYIRTSHGRVTMAYEGKNDGLYVLPDGAEEWSKLGSDLYDICGVSEDGKTVVWISRKNGQRTLYLTENEEKFTLGELSSSPIVFAQFSKDQKLTVVYTRSSDETRIWIKARGKDAESVKISGSLSSIVSNAGRIAKCNASQINYLFVTVSSGSTSSLYRISLSGEKEKVLSKVKDIQYDNGAVAYTDEDGDLYVAKMGKKELGEPKKLAGDVEEFGLQGEGKYLYYLRDDVLYGYKIGAREPVKVASDVEGGLISDDGKTVCIYKDGTRDAGYTLYLWKFGDKTPTKFASDATVILVEDSGAVYYRHIDGKTYDLMYYTGKESRKIGTELAD